MDKLLKEWLYALRMLRESPIGTAAAILVLAVAIGANSAIYTLTDNLSVTTPAGANAQRAYVVGAAPRDPQYQYFSPFDGAFADTIKQNVTSFKSLSEVTQYWLTVSRLEKPLRIQGLLVGEGFLQAIGVKADAGRVFEESDFQHGGLRAAMITRKTWMDGWAGSPDAIGSLVDINGVQHRIIGVLPETFTFERRDFGIVASSSFKEEISGISTPFIYLVGLLKEGVSLGQALAELKAIESQVKPLTKYPDYWERSTFYVKKLNEREDSFEREQINILLAVGLVILLLAAFNVANLTLARLNRRGAEYATRAALGASPWHLLRLSALENGTIVGFAYLLGIGFGYGLIQIVVTRFAGAQWGLLESIQGDLALNGRVLFYTGLACLLALGVISLTTLAFSSRRLLNTFVKQDSRSATGSLAYERITGGLLFMMIAISCALLVVGSFFFVSLYKINRYDYGYEFEDTWRCVVNLPFYRFKDGERAKELMPMMDAVAEAARAVPGVEKVACSELQFPHWGFRSWIKLAETPADMPTEDLPHSWMGIVSPGFFDLVGMKILQGRAFEDLDNVLDGDKVAVIDEAFAERHFKEASPLGEYVTTQLVGQVGSYRVIGIVANVRRWGRSEETEPSMYFPRASDSLSLAWNRIFIKSRNWNGDLANAVRAAINRVEPEAVLSEFKPLAQSLDDTQSSFRFIVFVQSLVSSIGFALSCVGIYSAVNYAVAQRRREMGVRLALGASPSSIRNRVVRRSAALLAPAILTGLASSYVLLVPLRAFENQIYLVETTNVSIYAFASASLLAVGLLAALLPAMRAAAIPPNEALREL